MPFLRYIVSPAGRMTRIAAGLGLLSLGARQQNLGARWALIGIGLVPLLAGAGDFCVLAPLLGEPFDGARVRQDVHARGTFGQAA